MDDRDRLLSRLRRAGCRDEDIDRAAANGRVPTLAVEVALGGPATHTLTEVARAAKLDTGFVRDLMQAMGRPAPKPRARAFSDDDLEVARVFRAFTDAGLPHTELLEVARVLSLGMSRSANAVRRAAGNALLNAGDSEFAVGLRYAEAVDRLAPLIPSLLASEFRAHLRHDLREQTITDTEREAGKLTDTREVAVAFADLVDYTRLGESLDPEDVGHMAGRLAEICTQETVSPVTLVKTIGDATMFVSPETEPLIQTSKRSSRESSARTTASPASASASLTDQQQTGPAIGSEAPSTSPAGQPTQPDQAASSPPNKSKTSFRNSTGNAHDAHEASKASATGSGSTRSPQQPFTALGRKRAIGPNQDKFAPRS
jgi:adenylate cyclase